MPAGEDFHKPSARQHRSLTASYSLGAYSPAASSARRPPRYGRKRRPPELHPADCHPCLCEQEASESQLAPPTAAGYWVPASAELLAGASLIQLPILAAPLSADGRYQMLQPIAVSRAPGLSVPAAAQAAQSASMSHLDVLPAAGSKWASQAADSSDAANSHSNNSNSNSNSNQMAPKESDIVKASLSKSARSFEQQQLQGSMTSSSGKQLQANKDDDDDESGPKLDLTNSSNLDYEPANRTD